MVAPRHIVVIAGEESGDVLGGRLCAALRERWPDLGLSGVGGAQMMAAASENGAAFDTLFDMTDLSVMGLVEVLPALPRIMNRMKRVKRHIAAVRPDLIVTIDAPDFNFRIGRYVHKACPQVPVVHYVAPTVWAWRAGRARKIARFLDGLMCVLPFEPPYFELHGLKSQYVGHPLTEKIDGLPAQSVAKAHYDIQETMPCVAMLFGSRRSEISKLGNDFAQTIHLLHKEKPEAVFLIPALAHVKADILKALGRVFDRPEEQACLRFIPPQDRYMAFRAADCAVAASGTVGLELSYCGTPHAIAYRMNRLTFAIGKLLVKVKFAHLGNIMLGRAVFPEFLQDNCDPKALAAFVRSILTQGAPPDMAAGIEEIGDLIRVEKASDRAVAFLGGVLAQRAVAKGRGG